MARTARVKRMATGVANYHIMSRTNDKRFLFEEPEFKSMLVDALRRSAEFSGVRLRAYTAMGNHFHVVAMVERTDEPVPEGELLRRVAVLKGAKAAQELSDHWDDLREAGLDAALEMSQDRLRRRMNDVSEFVKTFKEVFDRRYKRERKYCGSIWSGRFKSTLIEDGQYLATCVKYVIYNPIRAGIVKRAKDYPWSWCENDMENEVLLGTVPEGWCMVKLAQIEEGKVFGSETFVRDVACSLGHCFYGKGVCARYLVGLPSEAGASIHGWRLATMTAA